MVPYLVAALICDTAATDPNTGKKSLIGIFDFVALRQFPGAHPLSLYFKIADAEGFYKLEIRHIQADTGELLGNVEGELRAENRLVTTDIHISLPPVPLPEPGLYEFQLWANSVFLGSTSVRAVKQEAGQ